MHKCTTLAKKDGENTATWQIDNDEKLLIEIDRDPYIVSKMFFDIHTIHTKYINQVNYADQQYNQI